MPQEEKKGHDEKDESSEVKILRISMKRAPEASRGFQIAEHSGALAEDLQQTARPGPLSATPDVLRTGWLHPRAEGMGKAWPTAPVASASSEDGKGNREDEREGSRVDVLPDPVAAAKRDGGEGKDGSEDVGDSKGGDAK